MFSNPVGIGKVNGLFVSQILESIHKHSPKTRLIQASSREIFGQTTPLTLIDESTPRFPISPYGAAKLFADNMIQVYRKTYGVFACSAILFNHESPLRGESFVTRKISTSVAKIKKGQQDLLELASVTSMRDWGFAGDSVRAMWMMAQADHAKDYVIATGKSHSVEDFCKLAFAAVDLDYNKYVRITPSLNRTIETTAALGDSSAIKNDLNWNPEISFDQLVKMMVAAELDSDDK